MFAWRKFKRILDALGDELLSWPLRQSFGCPRQSATWGWEEPEQPDSVSALLKQLPSPHMPADLLFRIRHRISLERARLQQPDWRWRWRNWIAPIAVPASAGLLSALLIFGTFIRVFEVPVQAQSGDVPLGLRTPPRLKSSSLMQPDNGIECMVVQILIDENGRVADFHIVRGKQTPDQVRNLQYLLVFAVFDPATVFGKPARDTMVLALRDGQLKRISL